METGILDDRGCLLFSQVRFNFEPNVIASVLLAFMISNRFIADNLE